MSAETLLTAISLAGLGMSPLVMPLVISRLSGRRYRLLKWSLILSPGMTLPYASLGLLFTRFCSIGGPQYVGDGLLVASVCAYFAHIGLLIAFFVVEFKHGRNPFGG